jgi:hypothetical protein
MLRIGTLALFFWIIGYQILLAQSENAPSFNRFQIGVSVSPDVNYRVLKADNSVEWIKDNRDEREIPLFGFTAGVNTIFNFTRLIGVETAVQYSLKGYQDKWQDSFNPIQTNDPNVPARTRAFYKFHYLDIPIKANISVGKKRVRFIGSVGVVVNVYLASSWVGVSESQSGERTRSVANEPFNFEAVNISPLVSAGIDWKISDRMSLQAKPTFRYGVLTIIDAPIKGYLWNCGLDISWYFGFLPK